MIMQPREGSFLVGMYRNKGNGYSAVVRIKLLNCPSYNRKAANGSVYLTEFIIHFSILLDIPLD